MLELPWPQSINHYYIRSGRRTFISAKGKLYRQQVHTACKKAGAFKFHRKNRLAIKVILYPPDNRRRDIDNILKCLLDSLESAGLFADDEQIDKLIVERIHDNQNKCLVTVKCL